MWTSGGGGAITSCDVMSSACFSHKHGSAVKNKHKSSIRSFTQLMKVGAFRGLFTFAARLQSRCLPDEDAPSVQSIRFLMSSVINYSVKRWSRLHSAGLDLSAAEARGRKMSFTATKNSVNNVAGRTETSSSVYD